MRLAKVQSGVLSRQPHALRRRAVATHPPPLAKVDPALPLFLSPGTDKPSSIQAHSHRTVPLFSTVPAQQPHQPRRAPRNLIMAPSSAPPPLHVTIVGAGFAGIAQAVQLKRQLGNRMTVQVFDKADGPGGIWRSSTWPGAQVGQSGSGSGE